MTDISFRVANRAGEQGHWSRRHYTDVSYRFRASSPLIPHHEDPLTFFLHPKSCFRETREVGRNLGHEPFYLGLLSKTVVTI